MCVVPTLGGSGPPLRFTITEGRETTWRGEESGAGLHKHVMGGRGVRPPGGGSSCLTTQTGYLKGRSSLLSELTASLLSQRRRVILGVLALFHVFLMIMAM